MLPLSVYDLQVKMYDFSKGDSIHSHILAYRVYYCLGRVWNIASQEESIRVLGGGTSYCVTTCKSTSVFELLVLNIWPSHSTLYTPTISHHTLNSVILYSCGEILVTVPMKHPHIVSSYATAVRDDSDAIVVIHVSSSMCVQESGGDAQLWVCKLSLSFLEDTECV